MFKFEPMIDEVVKNTKALTEFVQHEETRKNIQGLIELQAEYTKATFKSVEELAQLQIKLLKDSQFGKFFK